MTGAFVKEPPRTESGAVNVNAPSYVTGVKGYISPVVELPPGYTVKEITYPGDSSPTQVNSDMSTFRCPAYLVTKNGTYVYTVKDSTDRVESHKFTVDDDGFGQMEIRADSSIAIPLGSNGNGAPFFAGYD
jgi:hypothetical protein